MKMQRLLLTMCCILTVSLLIGSNQVLAEDGRVRVLRKIENRGYVQTYAGRAKTLVHYYAAPIRRDGKADVIKKITFQDMVKHVTTRSNQVASVKNQFSLTSKQLL